MTFSCHFLTKETSDVNKAMVVSSSIEIKSNKRIISLLFFVQTERLPTSLRVLSIMPLTFAADESVLLLTLT